MHRNTKRRLAAALLAAVLCLAAVPQAFAEPWTYEVDSVMAGYGVEFYSDVGFEDPRKSTSQTTAGGTSGGSAADSVSTYSGESGAAVSAGQSGTAGTGHEISVYSADGLNVYSAGENAYGGEGYDYKVIIPAEVKVDTTTNTGSFTIKGSLNKCCNLEIGITSEHDYHLTCDSQSLPYKISDDKIVFWKKADETDTVLKDYQVNIQVNGTPTTSGDYTDHLSFTMNAKDYTTETTGTHLLTFDTNAGSDSDEVTISTTSKFVKENTAYGMLPTPKRDFYDFDGWYTAASGGTKVDENTHAGTADTTVYAHWTGHTLTILYHNDGADYIQWDSDPATNTPDRRNNTNYKYESNGRITEIKNVDVTLQQVETYGAKFSNGGNGLFNVSRWKQSGYGVISGTGNSYTNSSGEKCDTRGGLWRIGKSGNKVGDGDISGWTVKACAEALEVLDDLKQNNVTVDLYPTWVKTGKTTAESDDMLWDDDPVVLLPSLDDPVQAVVTLPAADTPESPAAAADGTEPADETPALTPADQMITEADDFMILPDTLQSTDPDGH